MKDNPDIRVAEAKMREAEAELNRTRLQVTQKVIACHHSVEAERSAVVLAENDFRRCEEFVKQRSAPQSAIQEVQEKLSRAKAKLAEVEAERAYLLGNHRHNGHALVYTWGLADYAVPEIKLQWGLSQVERDDRFVWQNAFQTPVPASMAEKIRHALDTPTPFETKGPIPLADVLKNLSGKAPGISFQLAISQNQLQSPVVLNLPGQLPLGAVLQALEDTTGGLVFVVRDYGILATSTEKIPPGALHIESFWKTKEKKAKAAEDKPEGNPKQKPPGVEKH
jgi:hypothetical protein